MNIEEFSRGLQRLKIIIYTAPLHLEEDLSRGLSGPKSVFDGCAWEDVGAATIRHGNDKPASWRSAGMRKLIFQHDKSSPGVKLLAATLRSKALSFFVSHPLFLHLLPIIIMKLVPSERFSHFSCQLLEFPRFFPSGFTFPGISPTRSINRFGIGRGLSEASARWRPTIVSRFTHRVGFHAIEDNRAPL